MLVTPKEREIKDRERQDVIANAARREDFLQTFSTPHGRRVLKYIVETSHMLESTCSGNAWSYFYEGERNWMLRLTSLIPDLLGEVFAEMMADHKRQMDRALIEAQNQ